MKTLLSKISSLCITTSVVSAGVMPVAGCMKRNDIASIAGVVFFVALLMGTMILGIFLSVIDRE